VELPSFLTRHKYGEIRLTGHRVGLLHVIERYNEGESATAIAQYFPSVPLELIEKTIAFYQTNRAEADAYLAACRAEIERQAAEPQAGPDLAELRRRLQSHDPTTAP
jgi:uncharacterized protein (DUF433 family)